MQISPYWFNLHFYLKLIIIKVLFCFSENVLALDSLVVSLPGNVPLVMLLVPSGTFIMGSTDVDSEWLLSTISRTNVKTSHNTKPSHNVHIRSPFYLSKYEITQQQWQSVMGFNPSFFKGCSIRPVEQVSWHDCKTFCDELNKLSIGKFRLPSEAEWEYACRAATTTRFFFGKSDCQPDDSSCSELNMHSLWADNSKGKTVPVGSFKPNPWGFYDLYGNVYEWCEDDWFPNYTDAPVDEKPRKKNNSETKILRGSWRGYDRVKYFTSFFRANHESTLRHGCCGLRIVREK